jgi:hypothetical protein
MNKNVTNFKEKQTIPITRPRKSVIDKILNYSLAMQLIKSSLGDIVLLNN